MLIWIHRETQRKILLFDRWCFSPQWRKILYFLCVFVLFFCLSFHRCTTLLRLMILYLGKLLSRGLKDIFVLGKNHNSNQTKSKPKQQQQQINLKRVMKYRDIFLICTFVQVKMVELVCKILHVHMYHQTTRIYRKSSIDPFPLTLVVGNAHALQPHDDENDGVTIIMWFPWLRFPQTRIQNDQWFLRF